MYSGGENLIFKYYLLKFQASKGTRTGDFTLTPLVALVM
jgi:hypothetical protein